MHLFADAVADVIFDDAKLAFSEDSFDGVANGTEVDAGLDLFDAGPEGALGGLNHLLDGGRTLSSDEHGEGAVGVVTLVEDDEVEGGLVAFLEDVVGVGDAVDKFVVDGDTNRAGIGRVEKVIGDGGAAGDNLMAHPSVELALGLAGLDMGL